MSAGRRNLRKSWIRGCGSFSGLTSTLGSCLRSSVHRKDNHRSEGGHCCGGEVKEWSVHWDCAGARDWEPETVRLFEGVCDTVQGGVAGGAVCEHHFGTAAIEEVLARVVALRRLLRKRKTLSASEKRGGEYGQGAGDKWGRDSGDYSGAGAGGD